VYFLETLYLDYNASTPIAPEVADVMQPFLFDYFGNPSSPHWAATYAKEALVNARQQVSALLGSSPDEIIFTSGGTESNNHALKGVYFAMREKGTHIITTKIEHPAILRPCRFLEGLGAKVTYLGVDRFGMVSLDDIERAITDETILISVMHANNEVGTIQPIESIAKLARKYGVLLHSDAAQSAGKIPTVVDDLGVDLLSLAGHKLYAPKGVGALYVRKGTPIEPFIHGAGHEEGRRAGTENVLLLAGLGKACELAAGDLVSGHLKEMRDEFWQQLKDHFGDKIVLNGHPSLRLPNTLNVSFVGEMGSDILARIPQIAASTGSACHSGQVELSSVLKEMNISEYAGLGTIRFSVGRFTKRDQIERAVKLLKEAVPVQ
jgi:cysteine desulfurase